MRRARRAQGAGGTSAGRRDRRKPIETTKSAESGAALSYAAPWVTRRPTRTSRTVGMSRTARSNASSSPWRSPAERLAFGFIKTRCHTMSSTLWLSGTGDREGRYRAVRWVVCRARLGLLFRDGRLVREELLLGFALHGRSERPAGFSRGRHGSGRALCGCDRFLNRSRGSRCSPPGLQSRPRFSSGGFGARCAACASTGDSHSRPRANHFITTSVFFRFNW